MIRSRLVALSVTLAAMAASTMPALAGIPGLGLDAPEIGGTGSIVAITTVAAIATMVWERRRQK